MASDQAVLPSAQVVGNAFVQQFYHILHQSPQLVYRFYQEGSCLGPACPTGAMQSITTMQAINDKILSMEYEEYRAEIKTVDAQESWSDGVIVLVTGCLTGRDEVKKEFTQSFFLAPQDKGYYVLNDIFRYVEGPVVQQESLEFGNGDAGHEVLPEQQQGSPPSQQQIAPEEIQSSIVEEPTPAPTVQEEVKVLKENPAPVSVPTTARPAPISQERLPAPAPAPASGPSPVEISPANFDAPDGSNAQEAEADGYSLYIKSLPVHAATLQLEEIFKKFGPINPDSIQMRGFCFDFVEFQEASSIQSAIARKKASVPVPERVVQKELTFSCPICMSAIVDACSTICGHVFCETCIKNSLSVQKQCPTCRKKLTPKNIHKLYFPDATTD